MNEPLPCGCRQWNQAWVFCAAHGWDRLPGTKPAPPPRAEDRSGHGRDLVSPPTGRTWVFRVPVDPALTSLNQRLNPWERHRLNQGVKASGRLAWREAGCPRATGRVRVSYLVRRCRRMDRDNIRTGLKPLQDGLFKSGITPDDSDRFLAEGEITQETGKRWRAAPEVIVTVEEL